MKTLTLFLSLSLAGIALLSATAGRKDSVKNLSTLPPIEVSATNKATAPTQSVKQISSEKEVSKYEQAVQIIKKYETLHSPKHWPLIGYGHKVLPGEKFSRSKPLSESEADKLLRKDLDKLCKIFRSYGKDSLILATLAYNIGNGAVARSSVAKKLASGNRDIRENYLAHCRFKGKVHSTIKKRRIEEFETLFVKDSL